MRGTGPGHPDASVRAPAPRFEAWAGFIRPRAANPVTQSMAQQG
jgi:hypothetical protein